MASRRVAAAALGQLALFGCGAGALAAWNARLYAVAAVLGLAAIWIAAAAAWQGRLRPGPLAPPVPDRPADDGEARFLATLLDQTPAPLLTRSADGIIRARNRAARALLRTDDRVIDPPKGLLAALDAGAEAERLVIGQGEGAAQRTYAVALGDVLSAGGPMRLAVLLDIEPEVRAAEAAALRELMQVLSHEIMNALTPVASLADTAVELIASPEPQAHLQAAEAVAILARRAKALARFADDYRRLARLPAPTRRPVRLDAVLAEVERLAQSRWASQGVHVTVTRPEPGLQAELDPDQVVSAVLHLVANGAEAAQAADQPGVSVACSLEAGRPTLLVRDNGPGVPAEDRARIFQPFFTTKPQGSGVGLSLARQIARAHGGELLLISPSRDAGATFQLLL